MLFQNLPTPPQARKFTFPPLGGIRVGVVTALTERMCKKWHLVTSEWISKGDVVFTWLSHSLRCLPLRLATMMWGSTGPIKKPWVDVLSDSPTYSPTDLWVRLWKTPAPSLELPALTLSKVGASCPCWTVLLSSAHTADSGARYTSLFWVISFKPTATLLKVDVITLIYK